MPGAFSFQRSALRYGVNISCDRGSAIYLLGLLGKDDVCRLHRLLLAGRVLELLGR